MSRKRPFPPLMAAAFQRLREAFDNPPPPAVGWPFVNPPAIATLLARRGKPGRKAKVTPYLVTRLVRFVSQGTPVKHAAAKSGISERLAYDILSGRHPGSQSAAVQAAGIFLPANASGTAGNGCRNISAHLGNTDPAKLPVAQLGGPLAKTAPEASATPDWEVAA